MKYIITLLTLYITTNFALTAQTGLRPRGDVNCDWEVNLADVNTLVDAVMQGMAYHSLYTYAYDINGDKEINLADVNALVDCILSGNPLPDMPTWSGTLPVLFINTEGHRDIVSKKKEDYLHADWWLDNMGIEGIESIGSPTEPMGMLIKGRGNYTWQNYAKKSFRIKLDEKQPLMGMHNNRHYCLMGHPDDYLARLKNTMGFELSRRIGLAYTPAQEPVEIVLNGSYIGLYFLTEKIRVGKHRVNIEEQQDMETDPLKVAGGWLLEITNNADDNTLWIAEDSPNNISLGFTPISPEILSQQQKDYIWKLFNKTNQSIYNTDKMSTDWENFIDIDTLALYYIIGEIMDDIEYFSGSCFLYKRDASSKLCFGPVWDFGNAFQRWAIYGDISFEHFLYDNPTPFTSHWIHEIAKFPRFQHKVRLHWQRFYNSGFNGLDINQFIDQFVNYITPAFNAEIQRWPQYDIKYQKNDFKLFIHSKIDWLQSQWGEPLGSIGH